MAKSKIKQVKEHLEREGRITPLQALRLYGCYRLSDAIYKLRKRGMDITTEEAQDGGNYAVYTFLPY
jgi:hypothetical protein